MKKLLILQNEIMAYRKPVYNGLATDYNVTVLHSGESTVQPEDAYREILLPCHRFGPFMIQNGVFREISSGKYDAIIAMFDLRWLAFIFPVLRRRYGKYIFWGHWYSRKPVVDYARDWLIKKADAVLLYGPDEIGKMIQRGVPEEKIFVAANTIHVPNHCDYSEHPKNSFLFVGRLRKRARVDLLIEAFAKIRNSIPEDVQLDIVGAGEEIENLHERVTELGLGKSVVFHGRIDQPAVLAPLFARAYAYVSPGHIGLGGLHSFAHGVPAITRKPVIPKKSTERYGPEFLSLKNRINSIVFTEEGQLQEVMKEICNDRRLAASLGRNAYNYYSKEKTLEIMLNGFKKAIET